MTTPKVFISYSHDSEEHKAWVAARAWSATASHRTRAWTDVLDAVGVRTGMNGKGRWIDTVFIECLWRSVKYKDIYLRAYEHGRELQAGLTALTRLLA
jgi:hypothetical protein